MTGTIIRTDDPVLICVCTCRSHRDPINFIIFNIIIIFLYKFCQNGPLCKYTLPNVSFQLVSKAPVHSIKYISWTFRHL